jgi:N-acetylneuraminic acid mutarotase
MHKIKIKMRRLLLLTCTILVLGSMGFYITSCNPSSSTTLPGSWDKLGDFAGIPRDGAVAFVINNFGYVGTGYNALSNKFLQDFWKYDPASDSWYPAAPFPGDARTGAVAFTLNGIGYVGCGYNILNGSNHPLSDFWKYDPTVGPTGQWTQIADFGFSTLQQAATVSARYGCGAFTVKDATQQDRVFVGWGVDVNGFDYKDLWEYDAANNVWIQRPDTGSKRVYPFIFVIDNMAYVGGGYDPAGGGTYPVDFNRFDVTQLNPDGTGSPWTGVNGLTGKDKNGNAITQPRTRQQAGTFSIGGFGYLTEGSAGSGDCWQYNPTTDTWLQYFSMSTNIPIAGTSRSAPVSFTVKIGDSFYGILTTGGNSSIKYDDCWKFNPLGVEPDNK